MGGGVRVLGDCVTRNIVKLFFSFLFEKKKMHCYTLQLWIVEERVMNVTIRYKGWGSVKMPFFAIRNI